MTIPDDLSSGSQHGTLPGQPVALSRFEHSLVRIARTLMGLAPYEQAINLLDERHSPPGCLTAGCVRLVEETLAKGCIQYLVRAGGWRHERFLRGVDPVVGRVWERIPLVERSLHFSEAPLTFLLWLTAEKPSDTKERWNPATENLTAADELFFFLANETLRHLPDLHRILLNRDAFRLNPFSWLATPGEITQHHEPSPPDLRPLFHGLRAVILECLQPVLMKKWLRSEREKGQIREWPVMRRQGLAEVTILNTFLAEAHAAKRPDLVRFVLKTNSVLLKPRDLLPTYWTGGLSGERPSRFTEELEIRRLALALPQQMATLQRWNREARAVSYFDEEYAASQMWKEEWEQWEGDLIAANAQRIIDLLDPLRTS